MKRLGVGILIIVILLVVGTGGWWVVNDRVKWRPVGTEGPIISHDLEKYDFDALRKRGGRAGAFEILGEPVEVNLRRNNISEKISWESKVFRFQSNGKWISGMVNYWDDGARHPTVIMVRGYAEKGGYYSGFGSWKMADELAKVKFNTVSIDFLGYATSDKESSDVLEARFEKVVSVLDLLSTISSLPYVDGNKIGFWAHSNGGQIVLSVLEVTGERYPTVLWAPMTQAFPQSILDTAEATESAGARAMINQFEKLYDSRRYAFENYYQWVRSPVKIFQGTADVWCKVEWQQKVVAALQNAGNRAELGVIKGDDHNFSKYWEIVANQTVSFLCN